MERRKSELLDDVIMRFMRQSGLEMPLNQYRLIQSWADVAGQLVAEQTKEIFIRNQTLYVRVTSPAMRANLMMNRTRLTSLLNKQVGADVITNIALMLVCTKKTTWQSRPINTGKGFAKLLLFGASNLKCALQ